ncbi:tetratricopeptide repeat protein [Ramlibacter sp.]|uniref:tetratricopeptide repeat protein n=1 Tax=Ramlibacter sp. TaxID=1917967 RepID=UPI0017D808F5|nr:tetratricopeptide repeat protein [Ramlibacter sp.]MBA2672331.1 tetratricopeptide repeat protein [Ramlibacter sp.]
MMAALRAGARDTGEQADGWHFQQARDFFLRGVGAFEAGRLEQAERHFAAALSLVPGRPSTLTNLGAVRLKLGRTEDALALLEEERPVREDQRVPIPGLFVWLER